MRRSTSSLDVSKPDNPQQNANWLSIFTFWYTIPIFRAGKKKELDEHDLTRPLKEHKSSILGEKMAMLWANERTKAVEQDTIPNLTKVIFKCFTKDILLYGFILFVMEMLVRLFQPIFLGLLLRYFNPENKNNTLPLRSPMYLNRLLHYWTPNQSPIQQGEAYVYASGILICSFINIAVIHPVLMAIMHLGMKIRVACCSLIYRKTLRMNLEYASGATAGNVVNLMSNDVNRFDIALMFVHYLWIAPLQMIFCLYFMYREAEISAVIGMLVILAFIPLQVWFGNRTSIFRLKTALRTDERICQMNEIIQGMQVIKMYTWEYAFADLIHKLRRQEIVVLTEMSYIRGMIMSFIMFTTRLALFLTVVSYVLRGHVITAEKVFVIASYYQILRQTMTLFFPQALAQLAEANVALTRIKTFLLIPESDVGDRTPLNPVSKPLPKNASKDKLSHKSRLSTAFFDASINIKNVTAKFGDEVCLHGINMQVKSGDLVAIIGQVGAGKSSLLNLILGELQPCIGEMKVNGVISYACQEPWLFAGTVRQNILFGREFERQRYYATIRACALVRDLSLFPYGDHTIIGERGVSLSGGQRARINLARAVYKRADIYLLDDPLSAVDTQVGKHLFDLCISNYLSDKIVVLVTHQLQYLSAVSQVFLMNGGFIAARGTYQQLRASGLRFSEYMRGILTPQPGETSTSTTSVEDTTENLQRIVKDLSITSKLNMNVVDIEGQKFEPQETAEMRTQGSVGCYVYKEYFKAGGNFCVILNMMSLFLWAQFLASAGDYFLAEWVNVEEKQVKNISLQEYLPFWGDVGTKISILIYSVIIGLTIFVAITRSFVFFSVCMRASMRLHDRMFASIITASMKFFNTNTSGRILNRFSKDLGAIDELLPVAMIDCAQIVLNLVGAIGVVGVINYYLLIPTALICILFYFLRQYYLHTSRSIKRLEGITRSPVFAHLNATLQGLSTIRSNGAEMILTREFDRYQDLHSSAWFMFIAIARAFGLWLDIVCTIYIGLIAYSFLVFETTSSQVGLAITQAIGLSGIFQWGLKQSAELENQMTSVERVLEYTRVEHEPELHSMKDNKPPDDWPSVGRIEFKNLEMRYQSDEPPVLKSLNFVIEPQEKIGIVGRTGAGKSSMIAALFRLTPFEGQVLIDGMNTTQIGLHDLRQKISIIPQEPVLFSGTLRYNMDPFHQYKDEAILAALTDVEMKVALTDGPACLEHVMAEGGANFSVGERQMVCLARAILRNNKILVLDEATANVDPQTDEFIQTTIREKFARCTVLTIAHRLHTVMDNDKVLVMDAGIIVEFDHPHILLKNKNGYLTKMVNKTGIAMADNLRGIAKQNYESKHKTT